MSELLIAMSSFYMSNVVYVSRQKLDPLYIRLY